jgi:hypothetical protein
LLSKKSVLLLLLQDEGFTLGKKNTNPNYNALADVDNNNEVNIADLYEVAKDYGKTV